MRVRLIYRKDLHTSEVGTLELDSPGPLVAVHTEDVSVQHSQRCLVYGLSYHCHEEKCKCGDGDKLLFTDGSLSPGKEIDAPLSRICPGCGCDKGSEHESGCLVPIASVEPSTLRTYGPETIESIDAEIHSIGHIEARELVEPEPLVGESVEGTVYDERANLKKDDPEPVEPVVKAFVASGASVESKSYKKRIAVQAKGKAKQKR